MIDAIVENLSRNSLSFFHSLDTSPSLSLLFFPFSLSSGFPTLSLTRLLSGCIALSLFLPWPYRISLSYPVAFSPFGKMQQHQTSNSLFCGNFPNWGFSWTMDRATGFEGQISSNPCLSSGQVLFPLYLEAQASHLGTETV